MIDEDRWKIEGRARAALRDAKKNLAFLKTEIDEYARKLKEASENLEHFLSHPCGPGPTGMTSLQYTLHFHQNLIPPDIEAKLGEYEQESERVRDLESKVSQFGN